MGHIKLFNIKAKKIHCILENEIKKYDLAYEMTRGDLLIRFVESASGVSDWAALYNQLIEFKNEVKDELIPHFTNWQAKYDEGIEKKLETVYRDMTKDLKESGIITRVLQTQLMLQLMQFNYLLNIKKIKHLIVVDDKNSQEKITLPEMAATLTEVILKDRDGDTLKNICKLLMEWRQSDGKRI